MSIISLPTDARSVWYEKPVEITTGDYLIDKITKSTNRMIAHTRIAVSPKSKAEWGMGWGNPDSCYTLARIIIPTMARHDDTYMAEEAVLRIEEYAGGHVNVVSTTPLADMTDVAGRPNSIKLTYDSRERQMSIYAGDDTQHLLTKRDAPSECLVWYFTEQNADLIGCGALVLNKKISPTTKVAEFADADQLMEYMKTNEDEHEGIWRYLDRDLNEKYASLGGRYTIATVSRGADEYDILYLSGADTNEAVWQPLSLKGTLRPTIFKGNYDMRWIGSDGQEHTDDTNAQFTDDGSILILRFPALDTQLRFSRLILR